LGPQEAKQPHPWWWWWWFSWVERGYSEFPGYKFAASHYHTYGSCDCYVTM